MKQSESTVRVRKAEDFIANVITDVVANPIISMLILGVIAFKCLPMMVSAIKVLAA